MAGPWDAVGSLLGFGDPSGNDHGSSNWAAWGHAEIRSMLDTSVDPVDISEAARAWQDQGRDAAELVTGLTRDLNGIVSGGWRGASADAAITALGPIDQWSASIAHTCDQTTQLMDDSGSSAGQAKATVPPARSHDWGQSLRSFAVGGLPGAVIDAVAQDQAQASAHAEAVQIMNNVYSAPINDHRAAVPVYPQLADPTLQPPDQSLSAGPAPGPSYSGAGVPGTGAGMSAAGAGMSGNGHIQHLPPAAAALQGVASGGATSDSGVRMPPDHAITRGLQHPGGQTAAAAAAAMAAGVPIAGGAARLARRAGGGSGLGTGQAAGRHAIGAGRTGAGSATQFGPQRSGVAAEAAESRAVGTPARGAITAASRAGLGSLMSPIAGGAVGAGGRGRDGEDTEHRRPSYLIEMDDVFTDGRKVAPPVIGEDPPAHGR